MKLAFAMYRYFPHGGLTRDAIAIARACRQRGHEVTMYAAECRSSINDDNVGVNLRLLPTTAITNHGKSRQFVACLKTTLAQKFNTPDLLVGFNKMPGLDMYYAADGCFAEKSFSRGWWCRYTPRYRHFLNFEKAVFAHDATTQILMIARNQISIHQNFYNTPLSRITLLPPGIARDRIKGHDAHVRRKSFRKQWQLADDDKLLLALGSGFRTKGLERSLYALAALPSSCRDNTRLFIVGDDNVAPFEKIARRLHIDSQVKFLGGRDDVPEFLLGADLLMHPAHRENTGSVLLEAIVAGLPVVTTDVCGYAHYVRDQNMGEALPSPFNQTAMNHALLRMMKVERNIWYERALHFAQSADIYDMPMHACRRIEEIFERNKTLT